MGTNRREHAALDDRVSGSSGIVQSGTGGRPWVRWVWFFPLLSERIARCV